MNIDSVLAKVAPLETIKRVNRITYCQFPIRFRQGSNTQKYPSPNERFKNKCNGKRRKNSEFPDSGNILGGKNFYLKEKGSQRKFWDQLFCKKASVRI